MKPSKVRLKRLIDELARDHSHETAIESAVTLDVLLSALESAFPEVFGISSSDLQLPAVVDRLVSRNLLPKESVLLATRIQECIELGEYPHGLSQSDSERLGAMLREFAKKLTPLTK